MRLQFLSQIRGRPECLHFRQRWYIHRRLQRYSQIILNRNHYLHQVLIQFFWRENPLPLRPIMMSQLPPQSHIPNKNLLFHCRKSLCITSQSQIKPRRHFKRELTTRWGVLLMKINYNNIILCCIFILLFKGNIFLPLALHKLIFQSIKKTPLVDICILFWCYNSSPL